MFKFVYQNSYELAQTLAKTKNDYKLKNIDIANALNVSVMTISNWLNFKTKIGPQYHESVEDFIARTWQPGIICVWNPKSKRHGEYILVGSIHDPFYTWINNDANVDVDTYTSYLERLENEVKNKEGTLHIVKTYTDLDEANVIGRDEEHQYNIGSIGNASTIIHFVRLNGEIEDKPALFFNPYEKTT